MGLRKALGLRGIRSGGKSRYVEFRTIHLDSFDPDDPLRLRYHAAIDAAQDGRADNVHKQMRYFVLAQLAAQAAERFPDLDFAECGCFFGHSTYMLSQLLKERPFRGAFHVFDSFEGLSAFEAADRSAFRPTDEACDRTRKRYVSDFDKVAQTLAGFDFVRLHKGWIPERFEDVAGRQFGFVSIDVDLHQPTLDSMAFFYPRLAEGGLMFFDDYGYKDFPGAREAIDAYLGGQPKPGLFVRLPHGSAFLQK